MKIIKKGEVAPKTKQTKCYKCKTQLEYDNSDIQQDRDGVYIICQECGAFITVKYLN